MHETIRQVFRNHWNVLQPKADSKSTVTHFIHFYHTGKMAADTSRDNEFDQIKAGKPIADST